YDQGQLIALNDGQLSDAGLGEAAASGILKFTYGEKGLDLFPPLGTTEEQRDDIERQFENRVRYNIKSGYWEAVSHGVANRIESGHFLMDWFRKRIGDPHATVAHLAK